MSVHTIVKCDHCGHPIEDSIIDANIIKGLAVKSGIYTVKNGSENGCGGRIVGSVHPESVFHYHSYCFIEIIYGDEYELVKKDALLC